MRRADLRAELLRALPYAILLALALGTVLVLGLNLSNASPSESRPFGWPGTAPFWNGVSMVRSDLVLATSLPALLLGVAALRGREPSREGVGHIAHALPVHAALLVVAVLVATTAGALIAREWSENSFLAFATAHALLALSFYALALLSAALAPRIGLALAGGVWLAFHAAYEAAVRLAAFRLIGYNRLVLGDFDTWFYVAQAFSPLSAYRGTLILWEREFMNHEESFTLGQAVLPAWVNPMTFLGLGLVLWVLVPVGLALLAWWWRARAVGTPARRAEPA